jgi:hypothetical protein
MEDDFEECTSIETENEKLKERVSVLQQEIIRLKEDLHFFKDWYYILLATGAFILLRKYTFPEINI